MGTETLDNLFANAAASESKVLDFVGVNTLPDHLFQPETARSDAQNPGKSRFGRPNAFTSSGLNVEDLADFAVHTHCDADQAVELLNALHDRYVPGDIHPSSLRDRAYELLGLSSDMKPNLDLVNEEYWRSIFQAYQVYQQLIGNNMIGNRDNETLQNQRKMREIFEVLYLMRDLLHAEQRWISLCDPTMDQRVPEEVQIFKFSPFDYSSNNSFQNLLIYLLQQAYSRGYRRLGEDCYVQIKSPQGYNTHAWKRVSSIREFIHKVVQKEVNYGMWQALTASANTASRAAEYLAHHVDVEFPDLVMDRHIFSFRNGVLKLGYFKREKDSMETTYYPPKFYPYDSHPLPDGDVACKYFDLMYNHADYWAAKSWQEIATPVFQSVLDSQQIPPDAQEMMYVLVGRLCYDLGEYDNWQVMPFIQGVANSGKSSICRQIHQFYSVESVGTMSSNMEHKFWASSLYDKFVFLCYEARNDFSIPQGEIQSAISGEPMSIPIKYKTAVSTVWKVPGFMVGNQVPNWIDAAGSMTRRLVVWIFPNRIRKADPNLMAKLAQETPALLCKCNSAYLLAVQDHGNKPVWEWWPDYFNETQKKLAAQIRPVLNYLESTHKYVRNRNYYMKESDFRRDYNVHVADCKGRAQTWNESLYGTVFEEEGITIVKNQKRMYDGVEETCNWLVGIGYRDYWEPSEANKDKEKPAEEAPNSEKI